MSFCSLASIFNSLKMTKHMLGLRTIIYKVDNLQIAKEWYTHAFKVNPYFDEPFYVGFNIGGYELGLIPDSVQGEKGDNVIAYWGVDDIQKDYKRLIEHGATEHEKPNNVGGDIIVASLGDPWGNVIGLIYNPLFKLEQ